MTIIFARFSLIILVVNCLISSCSETNKTSESKVEKSNWLRFEITEKTDVEYPDNPDIGFRSNSYSNTFFKSGRLKSKDSLHYQFQFELSNGDTLLFEDIDITEWIPTIPNRLKEDAYLSELALINHEWNRNQVSFDQNYFNVKNENIQRVDIARNCLNSYLWEVIVYEQRNNTEKPIAHGWFNFPELEYMQCFLIKNDTLYEPFKNHLADWKDPENKRVEDALLRTIKGLKQCSFEDKSNEMYPETGERAKKRKEVVFPVEFSTMRQLQTDSTTFATFSPPGVYDRSDPRKTELGRLKNLDSVLLKEVMVKGSSGVFNELEFQFSDQSRKTNLIIGGIDWNEIPTLSTEENHKGWQNSMGFGNHTFYENYTDFLSTQLEHNPYYGYFTDGEKNWYDSHKIGVDGPLMHFDNLNPKLLHVWLLSFERHALVGHYTIEIN